MKLLNKVQKSKIQDVSFKAVTGVFLGVHTLVQGAADVVKITGSKLGCSINGDYVESQVEEAFDIHYRLRRKQLAAEISGLKQSVKSLTTKTI